MEKLNTSQSDTDINAQPAAGSGFGKVLGSIQGLRQRLSDFSFDEVATTEANVRSLIKQLVVMRDRLDDLLELKQAVIEANRRIDEIPEPNFDLVSLDSLEKHPQLHAIVQASKLIRFHRLMKAAHASANAVSFDIESHQLHIGETLPVRDDVVPSPPQQIVATIAEKEIAIERDATRSDLQLASAGLATIDTVEVDAIDASVFIPIPAAEPEVTEAIPGAEVQIPVTAATEEVASVQIDAQRGQPTDWTFEVGDPLPAFGEASRPEVNFIFPNDTIDEQKPAPPPASTIILPPPDAWMADAAAKASTRSADNSETPLATEKNQKVQSSATPAETAPGASAPRKPDDGDIDQRLLDELIQNYGDFTAVGNLPAQAETRKPGEPQFDNPTVEGSPAFAEPPVPEPQLNNLIKAGDINLPALVETSEAEEAQFDDPAVETAPPFEQPVKTERQLNNVKKAGDLDRQLKKIIKDYGENDLYPRQSLVNLKTGGIAAFAVLGLVLGGLYLFKTPTAATPVQAKRIAPLSERQTATPKETVVPNRRSGGALKTQLTGPEAANASTESTPEIKQNP